MKRILVGRRYGGRRSQNILKNINSNEKGACSSGWYYFFFLEKETNKCNLIE